VTAPVVTLSLDVENPTWLNDPVVFIIYILGLPENAEVFDVTVHGVDVSSPLEVKVMLLATESQDGELCPIYARPTKF